MGSTGPAADAATGPVLAVFLHGTGTGGARAWPRQVEHFGEEAAYVDRVHPGDHPDVVAPEVRALLAGIGPTHLVAHSYGCLSAARVAGEPAGDPDQPGSPRLRRLTLVEPPFLSLTQEWPLSRTHLAGLRPIFDRRDGEGLTDRELVEGFNEAVGMPVRELTDEQVARARCGCVPSPRPGGSHWTPGS